MTAEDDEKSADAEALIETIQQDRQEKKEQVTSEWVETIREAGELYREVEDIEDIAAELDLDADVAEEALAVYRLIFEREETPDVPIKTLSVGVAYFGINESADDEYDSEYYDEPLEELLREYVGVVYLNHDVEELPVGDPPEDDLPSVGLDIEAVLPNVDLAVTLSALAGITEGTGIFESQMQSLATLADVPIMYFNHLSPILGNSFFDQFDQSLSALESLQVPNEVLADLTEITATVDHDIPFIFPYGGEAIRGKRPPTSPEGRDGEEETTTAGEVKEVEAELEAGGTIDATAESIKAQRAPDPGFAETTVDATLPDIEFSYEIPALVVQSILNSGQAYTWFCGLPSQYQTAVVGFLLVHVTISLGFPLYAPAAAVAAPAVRVAVLESNEEGTETEDQ